VADAEGDAAADPAAATLAEDPLAALRQRVAVLEAENAALRQELAALRVAPGA
jgi:hypothetical protein